MQQLAVMFLQLQQLSCYSKQPLGCRKVKDLKILFLIVPFMTWSKKKGASWTSFYFSWSNSTAYFAVVIPISSLIFHIQIQGLNSNKRKESVLWYFIEKLQVPKFYFLCMPRASLGKNLQVLVYKIDSFPFSFAFL